MWPQSASKPHKVEIMEQEEGGNDQQGRQGDVEDDDDEDDEDAHDANEVRSGLASRDRTRSWKISTGFEERARSRQIF